MIRRSRKNPPAGISAAIMTVLLALAICAVAPSDVSADKASSSLEKFKEPVDKAVAFFADYFGGLDGFPRRDLGRKISEYLAKVAQDGCVIRRTEGRTGTVTWRVPWI